jgi:hypothetical protein
MFKSRVDFLKFAPITLVLVVNFYSIDYRVLEDIWYRWGHLLYVKKLRYDETGADCFVPLFVWYKRSKKTENILLLAGTEANILDESQE